jgi:hypothetical protein
MVPRACNTRFLKIVFDSAEIFAFPPVFMKEYKPIAKIINNNIPEFKSEVPD